MSEFNDFNPSDLRPYTNHLNERMTQLLRDYANSFESMAQVQKEQEIVLFNIFANERDNGQTQD